MFNNEALSVAIGLTFIFLLYSLLATILQELLATNIQLRSYGLKRTIRKLLDDGQSWKPYCMQEKGKGKRLSDLFLNHPAIKLLKRGNFITNSPSYLSPETFSKVLMDILRGSSLRAGDAVKPKIEQTLLDGKVAAQKTFVKIEGDTIIYLKSIWVDSQGDVQKFGLLLEEWFSLMMEKTTGWYKQVTQFMLFGIGIVVAVAFNVDSISIAKKLEGNPALTQQLVSQASNFVKEHPNLDAELKAAQERIIALQTPSPQQKDSAESDLAKIKLVQKTFTQQKVRRDSLIKRADSLVNNEIAKTNNILGLGYPKGFGSYYREGKVCGAIPGWFITALAISLGAPFWFDLLNKLVQLRGSVSSEDDKNKDNKKASGTAAKRRAG